jgi:hypothetical protein
MHGEEQLIVAVIAMIEFEPESQVLLQCISLSEV